MFKIVEQPRAWWTVKWPGVSEDGEVVENAIELRFILHPVDEYHELMKDMPAIAAADRPGGQTEAGKPLSHLCAAFVERVACDWRGVGAENGEPLKWSEENIRKLMNVPGAFAAILTAYHACRAGGREIRLGN